MTLVGANLATSVADLGDGKGFRPGDRYQGVSGKEYIFVLADEAIAAYDAVAIAEDFGASQLTKTEADDGWKIGIAQYAIGSGEYGFVQIRGVCTVAVLGSCAADTALYTSATAGSVDDSATSQTEIVGLVTTAANTLTTATTVAAFMPVEPFVNLA